MWIGMCTVCSVLVCVNRKADDCCRCVYFNLTKHCFSCLVFCTFHRNSDQSRSLFEPQLKVKGRPSWRIIGKVVPYELWGQVPVVWAGDHLWMRLGWRYRHSLPYYPQVVVSSSLVVNFALLIWLCGSRRYILIRSHHINDSNSNIKLIIVEILANITKYDGFNGLYSVTFGLSRVCM